MEEARSHPEVILYGSHARGDWVDDPVGGYFSDHDLLVLVSDERLTDVLEYWAKADDHLTREVTIARTIGAPVNFIVHSLADVNQQLQKGRSFFIDVVEQGIALYEVDGYPFDKPTSRQADKPRPLTAKAALAEARKNFDQWFDGAGEFAAGAAFHIARGSNNVAAFNFHQAAERLYHCVLLVQTLYSPKSHKLNFLGSQAESVAPDLIPVWTRDTKFAQRCFELLRQAYVNARYSPHYTITTEELEWIGTRIELLRTLVRLSYERRIGELSQAAWRPLNAFRDLIRDINFIARAIAGLRPKMAVRHPKRRKAGAPARFSHAAINGATLRLCG